MFSKPVEDYQNLNWANLWSQKNDYLEYQMIMLGQKHPLLKDSFSYYIGLGETAIQLVNSLTPIPIPLSCSHRRLNSYYTQEDLYNPLNITLDYHVRDIAEYIKSKFFNGQDITEDLTYYFKSVKLSNYEYLLLLARLIYPTYYFDLYEEIITDKIPDEEIKKITNKVSAFENIIKKIYWYYKSFISMPIIDWLE